MVGLQYLSIDKKQKARGGQSTVEYLLVLVVVMSFVLSVLKSDAFKQLFGENSRVFEGYKDVMEYSYRHAQRGLGDGDNDYGNYTGRHQSYSQPSINDSRFFIVVNPYGE